jgi:hypothetical protein
MICTGQTFAEGALLMRSPRARKADMQHIKANRGMVSVVPEPEAPRHGEGTREVGVMDEGHWPWGQWG